VSDLLEEWVAQNLATWSSASTRDQESRVRSINSDAIASVPLARLSVRDIERWHTRLRRRGMGDAGVKNLHSVLRAALGQAQRWGWVSENVASLARVRSVKRAPRGVMTAHDVHAVLTAAASIDPAAVLAFRLAAVTGARRAELAALRWTDVRRGLLTIDSAAEVVRRPGAAPEVRDAATKTANRRVLTLDEETLALVEVLRTDRERVGPWMFGVDVDPPNPDRLGYWWRRARATAGIDPKWRLHDLRHWSATVAIGQGHDVRTVAGRLGHANPAMTLRVYAHAVAAADQAVAVSLGDALRRDG
jgi:integrase